MAKFKSEEGNPKSEGGCACPLHPASCNLEPVTRKKYQEPNHKKQINFKWQNSNPKKEIRSPKEDVHAPCILQPGTCNPKKAPGTK